MKTQYIIPEIEVIKFKSEDVILTASNPQGDIDLDPWNQIDTGI